MLVERCRGWEKRWATRRLAVLTLGSVLEADVEHGIVESTAHEEFETEVVDSLAVAVRLLLLCLVPIGNQTVAESQAGGGVGGLFVTVEQAAGQGGLDVTDDFTLEAVLVLEDLDRVLLPCRALGLRDGG